MAYHNTTAGTKPDNDPMSDQSTITSGKRVVLTYDSKDHRDEDDPYYFVVPGMSCRVGTKVMKLGRSYRHEIRQRVS